MIRFKGNIPGGWFVIRVEETPLNSIQETLLGEITYLDPDSPDLNVTFSSKQEFFRDYPEDMKAIQAYMHMLMTDSSA